MQTHAHAIGGRSTRDSCPACKVELSIDFSAFLDCFGCLRPGGASLLRCGGHPENWSRNRAWNESATRGPGFPKKQPAAQKNGGLWLSQETVREAGIAKGLAGTMEDSGARLCPASSNGGMGCSHSA